MVASIARVLAVLTRGASTPVIASFAAVGNRSRLTRLGLAQAIRTLEGAAQQAGDAAMTCVSVSRVARVRAALTCGACTIVAAGFIALSNPYGRTRVGAAQPVRTLEETARQAGDAAMSRVCVPWIALVFTALTRGAPALVVTSSFVAVRNIGSRT
jgi:hypothetical protein